MNGDNPSFSQDEFKDTLDRIQNMKVAELKDVCRSLVLKLAGKKQDLIDRIQASFNDARERQSVYELMAMRTLVLKRCRGEELPSFHEMHEVIRTGSYRVPVANQYSRPHADRNLHAFDSKPHRGHSLYFAESPFYQLRRLVHGSPQMCPPLKGRGTCQFDFIFSPEEEALLNDGCKVYLLCGKQSNESPSSTNVPLLFPVPLEIHVNSNQYQKNFRGIKGQPGTAKPADITPFLKRASTTNKVQMIYTQTTESFLVYLYLVKTVSCDEILATIKARPRIHKNSTIEKIRAENDDDDDIVVSTLSVTLRDPLAYTKMTVPVQSIYCKHMQCFDGLVFLQSQMQLPTWSCPICQQKVSIESLAVSDFFMDILNSVPSGVDQIQINEDGTWELDGDDPGNSDSNSMDLDISSRIMESSKSVVPETIEIISLDSESDEEEVRNVANLRNGTNLVDISMTESHLPGIEPVKQSDMEKRNTHNLSNSQNIQNPQNPQNPQNAQHSQHQHLQQSHQQHSQHSQHSPSQSQSSLSRHAGIEPEIGPTHSDISAFQGGLLHKLIRAPSQTERTPFQISTRQTSPYVPENINGNHRRSSILLPDRISHDRLSDTQHKSPVLPPIHAYQPGTDIHYNRQLRSHLEHQSPHGEPMDLQNHPRPQVEHKSSEIRQNRPVQVSSPFQPESSLKRYHRSPPVAATSLHLPTYQSESLVRQRFEPSPFEALEQPSYGSHVQPLIDFQRSADEQRVREQQRRLDSQQRDERLGEFQHLEAQRQLEKQREHLRHEELKQLKIHQEKADQRRVEDQEREAQRNERRRQIEKNTRGQQLQLEEHQNQRQSEQHQNHQHLHHQEQYREQQLKNQKELQRQVDFPQSQPELLGDTLQPVNNSQGINLKSFQIQHSSPGGGDNTQQYINQLGPIQLLSTNQDLLSSEHPRNLLNDQVPPQNTTTLPPLPRPQKNTGILPPLPPPSSTPPAHARLLDSLTNNTSREQHRPLTTETLPSKTTKPSSDIIQNISRSEVNPNSSLEEISRQNSGNTEIPGLPTISKPDNGSSETEAVSYSEKDLSNAVSTFSTDQHLKNLRALKPPSAFLSSRPQQTARVDTLSNPPTSLSEPQISSESNPLPNSHTMNENEVLDSEDEIPLARINGAIPPARVDDDIPLARMAERRKNSDKSGVQVSLDEEVEKVLSPFKPYGRVLNYLEVPNTVVSGLEGILNESDGQITNKLGNGQTVRGKFSYPAQTLEASGRNFLNQSSLATEQRETSHTNTTSHPNNHDKLHTLQKQRTQMILANEQVILQLQQRHKHEVDQYKMVLRRLEDSVPTYSSTQDRSQYPNSFRQVIEAQDRAKTQRITKPDLNKLLESHDVENSQLLAKHSAELNHMDRIIQAECDRIDKEHNDENAISNSSRTGNSPGTPRRLLVPTKSKKQSDMESSKPVYPVDDIESDIGAIGETAIGETSLALQIDWDADTSSGSILHNPNVYSNGHDSRYHETPTKVPETVDKPRNPPNPPNPQTDRYRTDPVPHSNKSLIWPAQPEPIIPPPASVPKPTYSRSIFDIAGESAPAQKKQRIKGILGIELSEDAFKGVEDHSISPLSGRIDTMKLGTPIKPINLPVETPESGRDNI